MKTEQRTVYITDDEKVFDKIEDAQKYEKDILEEQKRVENLTCYTVVHSFDYTEGRGWYGQTYIITDQNYETVLQYCIKRYGMPLGDWYGTPHESWKLYKEEPNVSVDEILKRSKTKERAVGDSYGTKDVVFISTKNIVYKDLPDAVFPGFK